MVDEILVADGHVGGALDGIPCHVLLEGFFQLQVADLVAAGIVVQEAVEADALDGGDEGARGREGLKAAAGADAHAGQRTVLRILLACLVVDIGQRVQLGHHDVDIVAADAVALAGDALAAVGAGDGVELAALHLTFHRVEVCGHGVHATRVTDEDDLVSELFGA